MLHSEPLPHSLDTVPFRFFFLLLALLALASCTPSPLSPHLTFSESKVYSADQVATALADGSRKLQTAADAATFGSVQQAFVVKQLRQLQTDIAASPSSAPQNTPVQPPAPITTSDEVSLNNLNSLQAPSEQVNLTVAGQVRRRMDDEWSILGRRLSLAGDTLLARAANVILVRLDVGVNNYIPADSIFDTKRFAYVKFTITQDTKDTNGKPFCDPSSKATNSDWDKSCKVPAGTSVYMLEPEFSSLVSKDSLITAALEDYSGEFGGSADGLDLKGAGRYQRALSEGFISLVEEPLQFATYGDAAGEFGCAFGPVRKIVKRSWINPFRIFGDKYRIDHVIEPGARQCYALITLPKDVTALRIWPEFYRRGFLSETNLVPKQGSSSNELESCAPGKWCGLSSFIVPVQNGTDWAWSGDAWDTSEEGHPIVIPNAPSDPKMTNSACEGAPSIFPKTTSTFLLCSDTPISSDAQVLIGPVAVPQADIAVLGRYLLKITIQPNAALQQLSVNKSTQHVTLCHQGVCVKGSGFSPSKLTLEQSGGNSPPGAGGGAKLTDLDITFSAKGKVGN